MARCEELLRSCKRLLKPGHGKLRKPKLVERTLTPVLAADVDSGAVLRGISLSSATVAQVRRPFGVSAYIAYICRHPVSSLHKDSPTRRGSWILQVSGAGEPQGSEAQNLVDAGLMPDKLLGWRHCGEAPIAHAAMCTFRSYEEPIRAPGEERKKKIFLFLMLHMTATTTPTTTTATANYYSLKPFWATPLLLW